MSKCIPYGGWFEVNDKGEVIAICFKKPLSEKQLNYLKEWLKHWNGTDWVTH